MPEKFGFVLVGLLFDQVFELIHADKTYFFEHIRENQISDTLALEDELQLLREQNESLQAEIERLKKENNFLRNFDEKKGLQKEVQFLKKRVTDFEKEQTTYEMKQDMMKKELVVLREAMYQTEKEKNEAVQNGDLYTKEDIAYLSTKKIVVVGGLDKWRFELLDLLPNITVIDPKNQSFDSSVIRHVDLVLLNIRAINHGMSYRVYKESKPHKIPILYTSRSSLGLTIQELIERLKKER